MNKLSNEEPSTSKHTYLREICVGRFVRVLTAAKDTGGSYLWVVDGDEAADEARRGHRYVDRARVGVREVTRHDAPGAPDSQDSPPGSVAPPNSPGPAAGTRSGRSGDSPDRGRVNRTRTSAARQPRRRRSRRWAVARGSSG